MFLNGIKNVKFCHKKSFTLIELLVVIAIIGLLASTVLVSLERAKKRARDARRMLDIKQIQTALEVYYNTHGEYPLSGIPEDQRSGEEKPVPNWGWSNSSHNKSWEILEDQIGHSLPRDPLNEGDGWAFNGKYNYTYFSISQDSECNQQWYMLVYRYEATPMNSPGAETCDKKYSGGFNYPNTMTIGKCKPSNCFF